MMLWNRTHQGQAWHQGPRARCPGTPAQATGTSPGLLPSLPHSDPRPPSASTFARWPRARQTTHHLRHFVGPDKHAAACVCTPKAKSCLSTHRLCVRVQRVPDHGRHVLADQHDCNVLAPGRELLELGLDCADVRAAVHDQIVGVLRGGGWKGGGRGCCAAGCVRGRARSPVRASTCPVPGGREALHVTAEGGIGRARAAGRSRPPRTSTVVRIRTHNA